MCCRPKIARDRNSLQCTSVRMFLFKSRQPHIYITQCSPSYHFDINLWKILAGSLLPGCRLDHSPTNKLCRLLGRVTPSRLSLKSRPNVKLWRLLGRITSFRLWSKHSPNVKLCRLLGRVTSSRLWLKSRPNDKLWRLGRVTPFRLWSKTFSKSQALQTAW